MDNVPKGVRLHIGLYGRRNVGKSSLLNALVGQTVSIVSPTPGTTTDPVEKTMEFHPLGPIVFLDTAGVDDEGELGIQRRQGTEKVLDRTDLALLLTDGVWGDVEEGLVRRFQERSLPFFVVRTKKEQGVSDTLLSIATTKGIEVVEVSAHTKEGLDDVRAMMIRLAPQENAPPLLGDIVPSGSLVVLVVPVDIGAPKGRLILPQVQAIRDLLDSRCLCLVSTESDLPIALARLGQEPDLVICDSQVVQQVNTMTPTSIPLTTFSILMARHKGDLLALVRGATAIPRLRPGDKVLIAEACTHHPAAEDIGRVKIPRWLEKYAGGPLLFEMAAGKLFDGSFDSFALVIHCGGCVITRGHMLERLRIIEKAGVPVTNYGVAISLVQGVLERTLTPFPQALTLFHKLNDII